MLACRHDSERSISRVVRQGHGEDHQVSMFGGSGMMRAHIAHALADRRLVFVPLWSRLLACRRVRRMVEIRSSASSMLVSAIQALATRAPSKRVLPSMQAPSMRAPSMRAPSMRVPSMRAPSMRVPSMRVSSMAGLVAMRT